MPQVSHLTEAERQARLKAVFKRIIARNGDAIRKLAQS